MEIESFLFLCVFLFNFLTFYRYFLCYKKNHFDLLSGGYTAIADVQLVTIRSTLSLFLKRELFVWWYLTTIEFFLHNLNGLLVLFFIIYSKVCVRKSFTFPFTHPT